MSTLLQSFGFLALGILSLLGVSTLGILIPLHPYVPDPVLPLAILLGVRAEVPMVRGTATAFALGYVLDVFGGNPMGLRTFVTVAIFLLARGAGLRLAMRGTVRQVLLVFAMALVAVGVAFALRVIFEPPPPFPISAPWALLEQLLAPALATAALAPLLFAVASRLPFLSGSAAPGSGGRNVV